MRSSVRKFGLGQLTVLGVRPADFVEIAARAGYDAISPILGAGAANAWPVVPLRAGDLETMAMARRMADTGIAIHIGDGFLLHESVAMEKLRAGVELMHELGARAINAIQIHDDEGRGFDRFCQLREWTIEAGITVLIEFSPLTKVRGLGDALDYLARSGGGNVAVLVDLLHLHRSGGKVSDLSAIDQDLIGAVQLCDGSNEPDPRGYQHEARYERAIPGSGSMQVRELLANLPRTVMVDLEVPLQSLESRGEGHEARARKVLEATQSLLEAPATASHTT